MPGPFAPWTSGGPIKYAFCVAGGVGTLSAGLTVYRIGSDGRLDFARQYDVEATNQNQQFWSGMVTLA